MHGMLLTAPRRKALQLLPADLGNLPLCGALLQRCLHTVQACLQGAHVTAAQAQLRSLTQVQLFGVQGQGLGESQGGGRVSVFYSFLVSRARAWTGGGGAILSKVQPFSTQGKGLGGQQEGGGAEYLRG